MLNKHKHNPNLFNKIVRSDKANFKLGGEVNKHNFTYWYIDNQNLYLEQQQLTSREFFGLVLFGVLGPFFFWRK